MEGGILVAIPPTQKRDVQPVEQLAKTLAVKLSINYITDAFSCEIVETTKPIPKDQRAKNRKYIHYFVPDTKKLEEIKRDANIILFDDYFDTGTTLKYAAIALKDIGFSNVNIFTVGYTKAAIKRFIQNCKNTQKND